MAGCFCGQLGRESDGTCGGDESVGLLSRAYGLLDIFSRIIAVRLVAFLFSAIRREAAMFVFLSIPQPRQSLALLCHLRVLAFRRFVLVRSPMGCGACCGFFAWRWQSTSFSYGQTAPGRVRCTVCGSPLASQVVVMLASARFGLGVLSRHLASVLNVLVRRTFCESAANGWRVD